MKRKLRTLRLTLFSISIFVVMVMILAACGSSEGSSGEGSAEDNSNTSSNLSIATNPSGQYYHSAGSALAKVVGDHTPVNVTVRPFSGASAWIPLLNNGDIELGVVDTPTMSWGYHGEALFQETHPNVRTIVSIGSLNVSGYTVREDSDIEKLSDIKGRTVAGGYSGEWIIQKVFEAQLASVGLTTDDVEEVIVADNPSGMDALREGRVEAAYTGNPNQGVFLEADNAIGLKVLNFGDIKPSELDARKDEVVAEMRKFLPSFDLGVVQEGIIKEDTVVANFSSVLGASDKLSNEVVYDITKSLWENFEELPSLFGFFQTVEREELFTEEPPAPYHPGAIEFFKEIGVWTDVAEENNQKLLDAIQ